jgi:hypothetical protein
VGEPARSESAPPAEAPEEGAVQELHRRIEELELQDESAFGRFTTLDWLACALLSLVLPAALLVWFAR